MSELETDRSASDSPDLRKDFHCSLNNIVRSIGEKHGYEGLVDFLTGFAKSYYSSLTDDMKARGLYAVKDYLERFYEIEEASDDLKVVLSGKELQVFIEKCPSVSYIKERGHIPDKWFVETTATVCRVLSEEAGLRFELFSYEKENGKAHYCFRI